MFMVNIGTANLYTINKTNGSSTLVGSTGRSIGYAQSMAFDHNDGTLYWAESESVYDNWMKINAATGQATMIQANTYETTCLHFAFSPGGSTNCPAVTNVAAVQFLGTKAKITWDAPSVITDLIGYKIYDGTTKIGETEVGVTTFITENLAAGNYTFGVEAVYDDECTPVKVTATLTIKTCGGAIGGVDVVYDADCKATVTWDAVGKSRDYEGWLKWCVNDDVAGRVGWSETAGENMTAAMRFTPADLAALGIVSGQEINKVALGLGTELAFINTMEIRIWEGGTSVTDPGTLVYTFPLTGPFSSYPENAITEFEITPYEIDASKELRIGWNLVNTKGYPFGRDSGPTVSGKGFLIHCATSPVSGWADAATLLGVSANWVLKAWVTEGSGPPPDPKYNVYMDGELVASAIEATTYTHTTGVTQGVDVEWCVTQVCTAGGESEAGCKTAKCGTPPDPCDPVTGGTAAIDECKTATITWTAVTGAVKYEITRDGNTEEVAAPPYTEEAEFEHGVTYEWEIVTVCATDKSTAVKVTAVGDCEEVINELSNNVAIFPNPSSGMVTITAKDFAKVEVYNTVGQLIETRTINTVDVSSYNTGIYFFKVYDSNNNSVTKRVMVTK
jgi:hypothetical protein